MKGKYSKKNNMMKILFFIIIVFVIVGLILFAKIFVLDGKLDKMQFDKEEFTAEELGIYSESENIQKYRNIAILGTDSRYNDYEDFARTDCIMVASINKETNKVNLFSVYRDTFVQMDLYDKTRLDKINHAYYEGVENTLRTINMNFDLNIKEYILIDFEAVADLVDAVDGVSINILSDELQYINGYVRNNNEVNDANSKNVTKTGLQNLNGIQALAYARIRYTAGGDYKRTERMRTVLSKTVEKLKEKNLLELNKIIDDILPKVKTNINKDEIQTLLPSMLSYSFGKMFGFPYNAKGASLDLKDYYYGAKRGVDTYIVPVGLSENVKKLHKELFEEENYEVPETVKNIETAINKRVN